MTKPTSEEGKICEDYCKQYKKMPGLTLSKKIVTEQGKFYPKLSNVETVRKSYVNRIRGLNGENARKGRADKSTFKEKTFNTTNYRPFKEEINPHAKILILDIETAPIRAKVWDIWNQNVGIDQIDNDWFIFTWAAKWLFEKKVYSAKLTGKEAVKQDDKRILKGVWQLLNEADVVIAHNGDKFDLPRLNTRFIINRLSPPLPYQSIDTLKTIKRQFSFSSNKLDYVNKQLSLERKQKNEGMPMWNKCYIGDEKSLNEMLKYNIKDVRILEETYLRLRPWIKPHPNVGLFILDEKAFHCPSCGSADLKDEGKLYYTTANAYEQFRCGNCQATGRKRVSNLNVEQRRFLLMSTPK